MVDNQSGSVVDNHAGAGQQPATTAGAASPPSGVVRVGVAMPDISALGAINPAWGSGPQEKYYRAALRLYVDQFKPPVRIELVESSYSSLDESAKRSSCVDLTEDAKVALILAPGNFGTGLGCATQEHRTPVITTDFVNDATMRASAPYLFDLYMSTDSLMRNFVHWAHENRHLQGKKIGVYYVRAGAAPDYDFNVLKAELERLGYEILVAYSTSNGLGGGDDQLAAQRFRLAGVDLAILNVSVINQQNFMQYASSQGYKPTYIDSDYVWNTDDSVSSTKPADQYDGTYALTAYHNGEVGSGRVSTETTRCVDAIARYEGFRVRAQYNEWRYALSACDLVKAAVAAIAAAGPTSDTAALVRGLESLRDVPMARHSDVTFGPGSHFGTHRWRTVRWAGACTCWKLVDGGAFRPLWVP